MDKPRKKLSDILNGDDGNFRDAWDSTAPAPDDKPIPRGEYVCRITRWELAKSAKKGTASARLLFEVAEGPHIGHRVWQPVWLTPAALGHAKRDLGKLGLQHLDELERPLTAVLRARALIVLRQDDDGVERNEVRRFEVLGKEEPPVNPYPPPPPATNGDTDPSSPPTPPDDGIPI